MSSKITDDVWPQKFQPKPPRRGNAPGLDIAKLGLVDIGCVGTIAYNNAHCLLCPEREECERTAVELREVYKVQYYRTRSDIEGYMKVPKGIKKLEDTPFR